MHDEHDPTVTIIGRYEMRVAHDGRCVVMDRITTELLMSRLNLAAAAKLTETDIAEMYLVEAASYAAGARGCTYGSAEYVDVFRETRARYLMDGHPVIPFRCGSDPEDVIDRVQEVVPERRQVVWLEPWSGTMVADLEGLSDEQIIDAIGAIQVSDARGTGTVH